MCAVCTGHLLLMVEAPHTREQNKGTGQQETQHNQTKQQSQTKENKAGENSGASSLYIIGETR